MMVMRGMATPLVWLGALPLAIYVSGARVTVRLPLRFFGLLVEYMRREADYDPEFGISDYGAEDMVPTRGPVLEALGFRRLGAHWRYPLLSAHVSIYWRGC